MRHSWTGVLAIVAVLTVSAASPSAQQPDLPLPLPAEVSPQQTDAPPDDQIPDSTQPPPVEPQPAPVESQPKQEPDEQKPPAAVGEEGVKPRRAFVPSLFINLGDDLKHMVRWNSLAWLSAGGAMAVAAHQRDLDINGVFIPSTSEAWKPGAILGQSATLLSAAGATYIVGRARGAHRLQHLGMDELEALILADSFVFVIKQTVRRDRPLTPAGELQSGFSFPSGHATATFAAATVLQQHLGYRAGIPTYLAASYVAISRLHDNKHFASDVAFGATLGILIGRSVTWHGRHFYGSPMLVPGGAGILFAMAPRQN